MPNIIAYAVLLSWPVLAFWLYSALPRTRAIICLVMVPYLLLPSSTAIDLPAIPPINKTTWANLMLLVVVLVMSKDKISLMPKGQVTRLFLAILIAGPFITALQNGDPLFFEQRVVPNMSLYDALSGLIQSMLMILPFLVARACLATVEAHREMIKIFMVCVLIYSIPMLLEIRLSPQLHNWIYGFHPHSFAQQFRAGGFRPMVFLNHGLMVAIITMIAVVSAAALWRQARGQAVPAGKFLGALAYLLVLLVLCKSLAPLLYALFLAPLVLFLSPRFQIRIAALLAVLAIAYPALRGADLVPVEQMLELARQVNEDRAGSLQYRFDNERVLLERAAERPVFGWGLWGRNHLHDPVTGFEITTVDGYWIIAIGIYGWLGFLAIFGLLALPVLAVLRKAGRMKTPLEPATAALGLILGINMIDLLPNASIIPLTWMIAGSLLGYAERATEPVPEAPEAGPIAARPRRPRTIL